MSQTRLFIALDRDQAPAAETLMESVFEEDGLPIASFEDDEKSGRWSLSIYVPQAHEDQLAERMRDALSAAGLPASIEREAIGEIDWVSKTLKELKPVRAGRFIVHGSHDRAAPRIGETAVEIDAGMAFGTGHHGTTAGCLDMLDDQLKMRRFANALDLGTGTGVLAIAVAKSLPIPVLATDIDPQSTEVARENCRANNVAGRVACITATGLNHRTIVQAGPFDLVMANILAGPLKAMARDLARSTAPGGTVILSGLLPHQKRMIVANYRLQGLVLRRAHLRDGWLTLLLHKP